MQFNTQPIGRYAPSPTGAQHLGNLRTALVAWLYARIQDGRFVLRMEDLDTPRVVPGSADKILADLEWLGLDWDDEVMLQSQRVDRYQRAVDYLASKGLVYPCFCSRKDIQAAASAPHTTLGAYPGLCAELDAQQVIERRRRKKPALRLRVDQSLQDDCGDFVIKRADDIFAYQLAVVVDDLEQGITQVVRGADLAESTARQRYLAHLLAPNRTPIEYMHVPLMLEMDGKRMSKRDGSHSADEWRAQGRMAQELVAHLAKSLQLTDGTTPMSPRDLLSQVSLQQLQGLNVGSTAH